MSKVDQMDKSPTRGVPPQGIQERFSSPTIYTLRASLVAQMVKNLPVSARDAGSGRFPYVENGSPLWYSCLENPMDRGVWQAIVHGEAKSWTPLVCSFLYPISVFLDYMHY